MGRKSNIDIIRQMLRDGWSIDFIAKDFGIQRESILRTINRAKKRESEGEE